MKQLNFALTLFLLVLLTLVLAQPSQAEANGSEWYVAPDGTASNDCLSPATPCPTINGAINKAGSGDTVYVASGVYTGTGGQVVRLDKDLLLSGGWDATFTTQNGMSVVDAEQARCGISV